LPVLEIAHTDQLAGQAYSYLINDDAADDDGDDNDDEDMTITIAMIIQC